MLSLTLACPHEQVPLWLQPGETLEEWQRRQRDAAHRLRTVGGCTCGWREMVVGPSVAAPARSPAGLLLCSMPGCEGIAIRQEPDGAGPTTCYACTEAARAPRRGWTTDGRMVVR